MSARSRCLAAAILCVFAGCARFRTLRSDLDFMARTYIVSVGIANAAEFPRLRGMVVEWDRGRGKVLSFDQAEVGELGLFAFYVQRPENQYVMAFSDTNGNHRYDPHEPAWIHSDPQGRPIAALFDPTRRARLRGRLGSAVIALPELVAAAGAFRGARRTEEAETGWDIPIALGDVADLDDPRFSAVRGEQGLWEPASFPRDTGLGIYFLEPYDPARIPVLFVYGAAGSPQDWRTFFATLDRKTYQCWFFLYPSGRRLDGMSDALGQAVDDLHRHLGFREMHVVAHSMGGLVARSFLAKSGLDGREAYVRKFVSISTPWHGHEAASMGVKFGPAVVPSWRDMVAGSPFQKAIFARPLKGRVAHLLIYGHHSSWSLVLPKENDGTVSVASELHEPAVRDAIEVKGFDADHVGILSRPDVVQAVEDFLGARPAAN
jgi:pimeloyl-ACP methyl ester carboxylesterase